MDGVKKVGDSVVLERLSVACGGRGGVGPWDGGDGVHGRVKASVE